MRRKTGTSPTLNETRSSTLSHRSRPAAKASPRIGLLKKFRSERITVPTRIFLSSGSTATWYSCSKSRKRSEPASLSRQSVSIWPWTAARMRASCSSGEGRASRVLSTASIVSWTTLPAHMGRADSFFSRWISGSSLAALHFNAGSLIAPSCRETDQENSLLPTGRTVARRPASPGPEAFQGISARPIFLPSRSR